MLSIQEQKKRIAEELARLSGRRAVERREASVPTAQQAQEPIAIVGLAGSFPGCESVEAFWQAVDDDRCLLEPVPASRLALWSEPQPDRRDFLKAQIPGGGFIPNIRGFDARFFGILPGQAHAMDPRQRLLLMSVYHCLQHAGYDPGSLKQKAVGVFVGIEEDEYFQCLIDRGVQGVGEEGLSAGMVANRVSWFFDFRGPSEVVNTMCSGGAVALHRAVNSLRMRESAMAVVGAANLLLRPEPFIGLCQTGQLSRELAVRSFGRDARGFLRAEGVGAVLLKRLSEAEADGDLIHAVIRHSAVNYNGKGGLSISGPDIATHAELIARCYRQSGVDPREISYIEAQGMGHPVADLAEWQAFNRALTQLAQERGIEPKPGACRVGTLKPMTGHMHSASALGALFRVIRSLQTGTIHQILGFTELNPELEIPGQPCAPARLTEPWPSSDKPRLAGIHSYGAGGNNAHLLIQEYRTKPSASKPSRQRIPAHKFQLKDCWYDHLPHSPVHRDDGHSEAIVRELLSRYLEVSPEQVELDAPFADHGFSSKLVAELDFQLRQQYGVEMDAARFFEFKTPRQLVLALQETSAHSNSKRNRGKERGIGFIPIAVVGMAGRYPGSNSVDEFWENLRAGRECITEIPPDRWPVAEHFDPNPETAARQGKSYGKWGGFIEGLNEFDPLFFKISPLEAETMNPKERLILQTVWHLLEDAGQTPERLSRSRVGVFLGVTRAGWDPYPGTFSSVANRVSYFCDFHGPSLAIDTMCSSSLMAIHEACQHLQTGSCDVAIAGGVNLYVHPSHFVVLAHGRFLSPDGKCRAFGAGANGMTPGEGVGAVLLKPLDQAVRDGDRIYGVIRCSVSNHGGAANGYTVPNPAAQKELIIQALETGGIDPRTISYVEAHGTGTSLGDPIEIRGLTEAYRRFTQERGFCRVGSLKSNMGHLEAAAGVASLTKVLMQMTHRELAPSLHASEPNPEIDFASTPFVVQQSLEPWTPNDAAGRTLPRVAAISSFGAGGSNAHLIVEEYQDDRKFQTDDGPQLIVLSARNEERLRAVVGQLHDFLGSHADIALCDLAYSLQVGRQGMEERLALRVDSLDELRKKLERILSSEGTLPEKVYRGSVSMRRGARDERVSGRDAAEKLDQWLTERSLEDLGRCWAQGARVDWGRLYIGGMRRRIRLPLYPFSRVVISLPKLKMGPEQATPVTTGHPLAQRNTSTLNERRFSSVFSGQEFFLADHVVEGRRTLPAAAYLEMARAAYVQSMPATCPGIVRISQVAWVRPFCVENRPAEIQVFMTGDSDGPVHFEIRSVEADGVAAHVYSQGTLERGSGSRPPAVKRDLLDAESGCRYSGEQCRASFAHLGIRYGPGHRGLEWLRVDGDCVIAKLRLPDAIARASDAYVLNPGLLDAAFQATIGFGLRDAGVKQDVRADEITQELSKRLKPSLPCVVEMVEIYGPCTGSMWAVIRRRPAGQSKLETFDIDLCDERGSVQVRVVGFSAKELKPSESGKPSLSLRVPEWVTKSPERFGEPAFERRFVVTCQLEPVVREELAKLPEFKGFSWVHVPLKGNDTAGDFHTLIVKTFESIRHILDQKPVGHALIQVVIRSDGDSAVHAGVVGLLRTARLEFPRLFAQLIEVDSGLAVKRLAEVIRENANQPQETWIRYGAGGRAIAGWSEIKLPEPVNPWQANGVYLITGGLGGLGRIFATDIARNAPKTTIVLAGRSKAGTEACAFLQRLRELGVTAEYRELDLSHRDAVRACVQDIVRKFGALDAILHAAGVLNDRYLIRKSAKDFDTVLSAKVAGAVNLDEASQGINLKYFVLFSSGATLGNSGQGDYAAANGFLDAFARYRDGLVRAGKRKGRTVAIAWPYWSEGGMRMDVAAQKTMAENTGMAPMDTPTGLEAFCRCIAANQPQVLVLHGDPTRLEGVLRVEPVSPRLEPTTGQKNDVELGEKLIEYLRQVISETLKIEAREVQPEKDLSGYGLDSIVALEVNNRLEHDFPRLSKTLFFEYATIKELAGYFLNAHREVVECVFNVETAVPAPVILPKPVAMASAIPDKSRKASLNMDEIIRTLEVEVTHPAPRASKRSSKMEKWPGWHSLFQSFAVFDKVRPEFSFSRMAAGKEGEDVMRFLEGQMALRRALFRKEDFGRVSKVIDLGCGRGADLIVLALSHSQLTAHGLTLDRAEAEFGNRMARRKEVDGRVRITVGDNAAHEFEKDYDIAFSIQVMHFIGDLERKRILFGKVARALCPAGALLMAEFVSLLAKPMRDPTLNTTVHTIGEWAAALGENRLVVEDALDLSRGIANSLHDPDIDRYIAGLDEARQTELRKYVRQVTGLESGWVAYLVLRVVRDDRERSAAECVRINQERLERRDAICQGGTEGLYGEVLKHFKDCVAPG